MIMLGLSFRAWLLNTTFLYPVNALAKMSLSKSTIKLIEEQARADREARQTG